jgi:hypothetical protein
MSSVWFTLRHGILTEVYYPSVDTAATRDLKMLVAADAWHNPQRIRTRDTGLGIHLADLPTEDLAAGATVVFRFDIADGRPEERQEEFRVIVADENPTATPAQPGSNDRAAPKAGFAGSKLTSPP